MSTAPDPAVWPREDAADTRLLHVDPARGTLEDVRVQDLPGLLRAGDLLVVNDVGTLPASLFGTSRHGPVEVRLAGPPEASASPWLAVLFGAGSWRQRTEDRPAPPVLETGDTIVFEEGEHSMRRPLSAEVVSASDVSPRLVGLRFDPSSTRTCGVRSRSGISRRLTAPVPGRSRCRRRAGRYDCRSCATCGRRAWPWRA
jgi:S-adenosylmethionine:tRNA ribosyltransferase-isomerase